MNYEFLSRTFLQGTSPEETKHMLSCLKATCKSCAGKGSTIWQVGDQVKMMGLVLNGSVHIESIDMMGKQEYS